ncbi:hypothetical protein R83H12_00655 [Fibrobacteria bacterium R8-3-H12]
MLVNFKKEFNADEVSSVLNKKGITRKCPICNKHELSLIEGFFNHGLGKDMDNNLLPPKLIISIGLMCGNCGHISFHGTAPLGLMPKELISKEEN